MLDSLAKDQFIDALTDDDTKLRVKQGRPRSLKEAVELSLELESFQLANKQRSRPVREVTLIEDKEKTSEKSGGDKKSENRVYPPQGKKL